MESCSNDHPIASKAQQPINRSEALVQYSIKVLHAPGGFCGLASVFPLASDCKKANSPPIREIHSPSTRGLRMYAKQRAVSCSLPCPSGHAQMRFCSMPRSSEGHMEASIHFREILGPRTANQRFLRIFLSSTVGVFIHLQALHILPT